MVYAEEFNKVSGSETQKRAQLDFDDLQNEVAGRDVGRIRRFLTGEQHNPEAIDKRRQERDIALFIALMQSAEYARLYEETGQRLREARRFLDERREQLALIRAGIEAEERGILARAARLPDGTLVFRGDDGRAYTRDGKLCDHPDAQNIIWRGDHAKLTDIERSDHRMQRLERAEDKLDAHDAELGGMQERYENTDEPLSTEELKDMQERVQGLTDDMTSTMTELGPDQDTDAIAGPEAARPVEPLPPVKGLDGI